MVIRLATIQLRHCCLRNDDALSREALLAEQVSLNRRLRQREDGAAKGITATKRRCQSELSGEELRRRRLFPSCHRCHLRNAEESASSGQVLQGHLGL